MKQFTKDDLHKLGFQLLLVAADQDLPPYTKPLQELATHLPQDILDNCRSLFGEDGGVMWYKNIKVQVADFCGIPYASIPDTWNPATVIQLLAMVINLVPQTPTEPNEHWIRNTVDRLSGNYGISVVYGGPDSPKSDPIPDNSLDSLRAGGMPEGVIQAVLPGMVERETMGEPSDTPKPSKPPSLAHSMGTEEGLWKPGEPLLPEAMPGKTQVVKDADEVLKNPPETLKKAREVYDGESPKRVVERITALEKSLDSLHQRLDKHWNAIGHHDKRLSADDKSIYRIGQEIAAVMEELRKWKDVLARTTARANNCNERLDTYADGIAQNSRRLDGLNKWLASCHKRLTFAEKSSKPYMTHQLDEHKELITKLTQRVYALEQEQDEWAEGLCDECPNGVQRPVEGEGYRVEDQPSAGCCPPPTGFQATLTFVDDEGNTQTIPVESWTMSQQPTFKLEVGECVSWGPVSDSPIHTQIGGEHYRNKAIQPIEYIQKNQLPFEEGNAIKYITRHREKDGLEDLKKAQHYIQFIIQRDYPSQGTSDHPHHMG